MGAEGRTITESCLTIEQWQDSQKNEAWFWHTQKEDNIEQYHRNTYYRNLLEDGCSVSKDFFEQDFSDFVIVDIGSGPQGVLHVIHAKRKIAVDPLMDKFIEQGYDVEGMDGVECICAQAETFKLNESVDFAVCLNAIDHFQSPETAIENIARNMKTGGELLLLTDLRTEDKIDCYHKLCLTEETLYEWMNKTFEMWQWHNFPHQTGNPLRQIVTRCLKK